MRVLILSIEFPPGPGGIGTHAFQLAVQLLKRGWEICVLSSQDFASIGEIQCFNQAQSFPIHRFRPIASVPLEAAYRWREASRMIKQFKPDLLVATGERSVWLSALLARRHRLRWVAVGHGAEFNLPTFWERKLTQWSFQSASAVVCVSRFTWQRMLKSGIHPGKGGVILNGGDSNQFNILPSSEVEEFKRNFGLSNARILVTVGNVTNRKGQDVVIRALPSILKEFPKTHYLIVGLPTLRSEFQNLAEELNVGEHVHFLGRVDLPLLTRLLNSSDVFVLTSRHTKEGDFEGFGIAVLEAALCGKPAVVTTGSGLEEAIEHGVSGIAVPENDVSETARAVISLLKDDQMRRKMAEAARRNAVQGSWEHRIKEYDDLFRDLIGVPQQLQIREFADVIERVK